MSFRERFKEMSILLNRYPLFWTFLIIAIACGSGLLLAGAGAVVLEDVTRSFQWGILAIFIALESFTVLIVGTGIMEWLAIRLVRFSQGRRSYTMGLFAALLFIVSAFLNNLTAVLVVLPIIFVLLRAMDLDQGFVAAFFSLLLAISNLAGAATPIGDFPAIIIMKSGITTFQDYLVRAFPLFAFTGLIIAAIHLILNARRSQKEETTTQDIERNLGIIFLRLRYKHVRVKWRILVGLAFIFSGMFAGWAFLPTDMFPPELIAFAGFGVASVLTFPHGAKLGVQIFDLKPILNISAFLFLAALAGSSGVLDYAVLFLEKNIHEPTTLLITVMVITAVLSGLCQAGPAAAAMMPLIQTLADGPLQHQKDWLAVAFAASICAGSSLFLWSATAGFMLANKAEDASLRSKSGSQIRWGVKTYLGYGVMHFVIQLTVGIIGVMVGIRFF